MKKMICVFFIVLFLPINILAYSKNVIPGGDSIGISINTDGLLVVGYYKVNGEYIAKKNIKIGDKIIKINNKDVSSLNELSSIIDNEIEENNEIDIELIRNDKKLSTSLELVKEKNKYKTGLYIKDSVLGLGTLTYIDPISKIYGSLGHEVLFNETNSRVEVKDGSIFDSKINGIDRSRNGSVGSKNATLLYKNKIGNIVINSENGIYGFYTSKLPKRNTIEIANYQEIEKGNAYILTVTKDKEIKEYEINILDKYNNKKNTNKAFGFEITDQDLINKTGGIVQGMSGSPIIQNDKLIGCVTNVVVDNVILGYGISIVTMLETGDLLKN